MQTFYNLAFLAFGVVSLVGLCIFVAWIIKSALRRDNE